MEDKQQLVFGNGAALPSRQGKPFFFPPGEKSASVHPSMTLKELAEIEAQLFLYSRWIRSSPVRPASHLPSSIWGIERRRRRCPLFPHAGFTPGQTAGREPWFFSSPTPAPTHSEQFILHFSEFPSHRRCIGWQGRPWSLLLPLLPHGDLGTQLQC